VPGEQMVFPSKSQRTDPVLDRIAVHLDMAVTEGTRSRPNAWCSWLALRGSSAPFHMAL
jgi:hypothetical protein